MSTVTEPPGGWSPELITQLSSDAEDSAPLIRRASEIASRSTRWLWPGWLARGHATSLTGVEEAGKSSYVAWVTAQATRGTFPGADCDPLNVMIIASEDSVEETWIPKLKLAGADMDRVGFLEHMNMPAQWNIRDHTDVLRKAMIAMQADIVYIDAMLDHFPPAARGETANQATFVRGALNPLKNLVRELDVVLLFTMHPSRGKFSSFRDTVQMSQAFRAVVRLGWLIHHHPDDDEGDQSRRRVVMRSKGNIGRDPGALEFRISSYDFEFDDGVTQDVGYVHTVSPSALTRAELMRSDTTPRAATKTEQTADIIRRALSDGQWHEAAPIKARLHSELASVSEATITSATQRLGVEKSNTIITGPGAPWHWRLEPAKEARDEPAI